MEKSVKNYHKSDNLDKSSPGSHSTLSNSSNDSHPRSSFKPYEATFRDRAAISPEDYRAHSSSARTKTPKQTHLHTPNGRESNHSAGSPRASPITGNHARKSLHQPQHQPINLEKNASPTGSHRASTTKESTSAASRSTQNSPLYTAPKSTDAVKESAASYAKASAALPTTTAASMPPFFGAYAPGPYPMDLMTASALMSPHHAMLKAAMNPYLNYAQRMKLPSTGADAVGCRDPFCTGCTMSPATPHAGGKCPPGCTQCDHSASSAAAAAQSKSNYAQQMSQAFAHAQLAALAAASQMPFVCNWIGSDAVYCGKRFTASDDLLQHLRTHTASIPLDALNPATAGLPPNHPLFQRTYPTPPLSPLSSNRYHPYGKASLLPPSMQPPLSAFPIPHPSLASYYPFNVYGSRLGSAPSMHP